MVFDFFKTLEKDSLSFFYQGGYQKDDLVVKMLDLNECALKNGKGMKRLKRKVGSIMIECFQNLVRHNGSDAAPPLDPEEAGMFFIRNLGQSIYVSSSNLIKNEAAGILNQQLHKITEMGESELKEFYNNKLSDGHITEKGGAGIGLIQMALKSNHGLSYYIETLDDKYSFFNLLTELRTDASLAAQQAVSLDFTQDIRHRMQKEDIVMMYKGEFNKHTILPVLKMNEYILSSNPQNKLRQKRTVLILVEIMQNIYKHGFRFNDDAVGLLIIKEKDNGLVVQAGNFIERGQAPAFLQKLETLNSMSKEALSERYIKLLRESVGNDKSSACIGLIDVARESSDSIQYSFDKANENLYFFTISVSV